MALNAATGTCISSLTWRISWCWLPQEPPSRAKETHFFSGIIRGAAQSCSSPVRAPPSNLQASPGRGRVEFKRSEHPHGAGLQDSVKSAVAAGYGAPSSHLWALKRKSNPVCFRKSKWKALDLYRQIFICYNRMLPLANITKEFLAFASATRTSNMLSSAAITYAWKQLFYRLGLDYQADLLTWGTNASIASMMRKSPPRMIGGIHPANSSLPANCPGRNDSRKAGQTDPAYPHPNSCPPVLLTSFSMRSPSFFGVTFPRKIRRDQRQKLTLHADILQRLSSCFPLRRDPTARTWTSTDATNTAPACPAVTN